MFVASPQSHFSKLFPPLQENGYIGTGSDAKGTMDSEAPPSPPPPQRKGVKGMLVAFAILAVVGVSVLVFSVIVGLILLAVAEVFFAMAYRRFSRRSKVAS
jgi:hypothetical protein